MILRMSLSAFTLLHVAISLIGIATGLIVAAAMLRSKAPNGWTASFLATTVFTSATGFLFPVDKILPSHIVGAISLVVLAVAIAARYGFGMRGAWRHVYVLTATLALYLNVFVGVVQSFLKIPALRALAPKQTEPPFVVSQGVVLLLFVVLAIVAAVRFRSEGIGTGGARPVGR